MIINGTTAGQHLFDDGYVVRWLAISDTGNISIWSAGLGVNKNPILGALNGWLGPNLFRGIGQENADKVRGCIKLRNTSC
jgi:hypothetical protein